LATARSGGEIGRILLASASEHFVHTLLFRVARRQVSGWLGSGPGLDLSWLRSYSVGLRQPTVFREVERGATFRGALAANPHHTSLARCWGGELERECLVLPLRVRGRLVGALYGDRGAPALGSIDTAAVERLAAKAGLAFERLILDRKLRN